MLLTSEAMILAVMNAIYFLIAKIAFITARIIASLDFISSVQYVIHFTHHFDRCYDKNIRQ